MYVYIYIVTIYVYRAICTRTYIIDSYIYIQVYMYIGMVYHHGVAPNGATPSDIYRYRERYKGI